MVFVGLPHSPTSCSIHILPLNTFDQAQGFEIAGYQVVRFLWLYFAAELYVSRFAKPYERRVSDCRVGQLSEQNVPLLPLL